MKKEEQIEFAIDILSQELITRFQKEGEKLEIEEQEIHWFVHCVLSRILVTFIIAGKELHGKDPNSLFAAFYLLVKNGLQNAVIFKGEKLPDDVLNKMN